MIVTDNMLEHNCSSVLPPLHLPPDIWPHSGAQNWTDPLSFRGLFYLGGCYGMVSKL